MVACRTLYPTQISRRPLLCRSNSHLEIIIVQSVAWPPLQSLHMGDPPPPNHNLCHSSLESRTEISRSCRLRKSMNGNCLKSNLAHGAFWKSETFLVVNGSWPDTQVLPHKSLHFHGSSKIPAETQFPISIVENNNLILSTSLVSPPAGGRRGGPDYSWAGPLAGPIAGPLTLV